MTEQSVSIAGLSAALVAAQADLTNPPKDSVNPHFKSKFADLATVRNVVVPALHRHGLAVTQLITSLDGKPALATQLVHTSGEWLRCTSPLVPVKQDPQGYGAAATYLRRYSLQAIAGVCADDDDDGHHASAPPRQQPARPPAAVAKPPAGGGNPPGRATADDLHRLAEQCCKLAGGLPDDIFDELWAAAKWSAAGLDALTPDDLAKGKAWLGKKLAALQQSARN